MVSGILDSLNCIPDCKAKDAGFNMQKFPEIRNTNCLTWGDLTKLGNKHVRPFHPIRGLL